MVALTFTALVEPHPMQSGEETSTSAPSPAPIPAITPPSANGTPRRRPRLLAALRPSCVVTLGWSGYGMAMADATEVLHRTTSLPCPNSAFLPPPDDVDAPYETRIMFDCAE